MEHEPLRTTLLAGDRFVVLCLSGELDMSSSNQLRQTLVHLVGEHQPRLVLIDCDRLRFVDSTGLGLIVGTNQRLSATGGQVALVNVGGSAASAIRATGLHQAIHVQWRDEGIVLSPWQVAGATLEDVAAAIGLDMALASSAR